MKRPGLLRRSAPLRSRVRLQRRRRPVEERVTPTQARQTFERDGYRCIAVRYDAGHVCEGRLSIEHVPGHNENAMGRRGRYLTTACLGAQQGWCLTNRDQERLYLEEIGVMPRLQEESTDELAGPPPV